MALKPGDFDKLTPEEKKALTESLLSARPRKKPMFTTGWPENSWHLLPGLMGLPVERSSRSIKHPIVIMSFMILFVIVHFNATSVDLRAFILDHGFIPKFWYRDYLSTFISSFFMHASWVHLLGNAYYFYIFGDDVEDDLQLPKFLFLLLGSHIFGIFVHIVLGGSGAIPLVGASAGVSGLMGYYMIRFPKRQISYLAIFAIVYVLWAHIPVFYAFLLKFGWELLTVGFGPESGVAHWAHLGGVFFGIFYAYFQKVEEK